MAYKIVFCGMILYPRTTFKIMTSIKNNWEFQVPEFLIFSQGGHEQGFGFCHLRRIHLSTKEITMHIFLSYFHHSFTWKKTPIKNPKTLVPLFVCI